MVQYKQQCAQHQEIKQILKGEVHQYKSTTRLNKYFKDIKLIMAGDVCKMKFGHTDSRELEYEEMLISKKH